MCPLVPKFRRPILHIKILTDSNLVKPKILLHHMFQLTIKQLVCGVVER